MQRFSGHPDISDFQQVSQQFSLINLNDVERQSALERVSLVKSTIDLSSSFTKQSQRIRALIEKNIGILTESVQYINQFLNYIKYSEKWVVQENYCLVFKKTHYLRMQQLFMVINILMRGDDQHFMESLADLYVSIKGFQIPAKSIQDVNFEMIQYILQVEKPYIISFRDLASQVSKLFLKGDYTKTADEILGLKVQHSKVYTICQVFASASLFPKTDIMNPSQHSGKRWKTLNQHITHRCYGSPETVHESFKKLKQQIIWANAAVNTMSQAKKLKFEKPEDVVNYIKKGLGLIGMLFLKDDAKKSTQRFQSEPDSGLTKQIFNMTDEGITKQMIKVILPPISFSNKIMIPRILNYVRLDTLPQILANKFQAQKDMQAKYHIDHVLEYRNKLVVKNPLNLQMRINCWTEVQYKLGTESSFMQKINGFFKKQPAVYSNIVLHIHGGGFISMSSYSHQVYTRKWANEIKVPFVSVDYAKAPEHPYPQALNDCLEAYLWILYGMPQVYQANPVRIFLVGDSAGGNLVAALTALLIRLNLKVPDGIFLIYPALNINSKVFTPSLLHSLEDFILPHTFLKICASSYIQNYPTIEDYLLSPVLSPPEILRKFPVTRLYVGSQDPFHDDCLRLTQKLLECDVNVHLTVYQSFGHGFLQFDNALQPIYEARNAIEQIGKHMKQIIWNGV